MTKSLDDNFSDWESVAFGYGYGSGEPHTIPAIKRFLELCSRGSHHQYDHEVLEHELGPTVTWLLINALCKADIIEYGTSPRYGWLTDKGISLKNFMLSKSDDDLLELICRDSDYTECSPTVCNCGPHGYEEGRVCDNPFWGTDRRFVNR